MPTANFTICRSRIAPVMAKLETTLGTDPTPAAATDDVLSFDSAVVAQPMAEKFEFRPHGSSFTRQYDIIAQRWVDVNLKCLLQTSGTNGSIAVNGYAGLDALISACGATSTADVNSIDYTPSTIAALQSSTVWVNHHGYIHKVNACVGNCVMTAGTKGGMELAFKMQGLYSLPVAVSTTFDAWTGGTNRAKWAQFSTALTINNGAAYTPVVKSIMHDFGIEVIRMDNMNSSTGTEAFYVIDRDPKLEVSIATDTYGSANITYDEWYTDWFSSGPTMHNVSGSVSSGVNLIALSYPTAQLIQPSIKDERYRCFSLNYKLQHTTANAEWSWIVGANA